MTRLNRKNLEIFYILVGVILLVSGIYSIAKYGFALMNFLYLIFGIYMISMSISILNKLNAKGGGKGKNGKK